MARFLLVHGSCHGAWCWDQIVPRLRAKGHVAQAIDLPSHGQDTTPVNDVTLKMYADAIAAAMDGPTVVVGHSMAGYPITAAAMLTPSKVQRLVYLCAYVPAPGKSLVARRLQAPRQPLLASIIKSADGKSFTIDPAKAAGNFYQDCPDDIARTAVARLCPQAIRPQATVIEGLDRVADIPKSYIRCMNDQTIPPEFQVTMTRDWPADDIVEMSCGHSPFFAQPDRLTDILIEAAEKT